MMDEATRIKIFQAQTENVQELNGAWKHLNRGINEDLVKGNMTSARMHTNFLALLFCAWSEANFLKVLYTPHGFILSDIEHILKIADKKSIGEAWKKCLELGLRKIEKRGKSSYLPNAKKKISLLIDRYVIDPAHIRNKIAHGQWIVALNHKNTSINQDTTTKLAAIDVIYVTKLRLAHKFLADIIEVLVESPDKAFHRDYWQELSKFETFENTTKNWTLEDKIEKLKKKRNHHLQCSEKNN